MNPQSLLALDRNRAAQAIERQAPGQIVGSRRFAIDKHIRLVGPDQKVEQRLALRGQQRRPDRQIARHIIGDEALQKAADIVARQSDQRAVVEGGIGHADNLGAGQPKPSHDLPESPP
jgi:hypothetical protein